MLTNMGVCSIILLIFISVISNAQNIHQTPEQIAKLEAKHGIRDIKLDTPKSTYKDLIKINNKTLCGESFIRGKENYYIGKAKVLSIEYWFVKNSLTGIFITFDSRDEFGKVLKELRELYGAGELFDHSSIIYATTFSVGISSSISGKYESKLYHINFVKNNHEKTCEEIREKKKS